MIDIWNGELSEYPRKFVSCIGDLKYKKGGVYFLWNPNGLQYIGESQNVVSRVRYHNLLRGQDVSLWIVGVIPADNYGKRHDLESKLIKKFSPPLNKVRDYSKLSAVLKAKYAALRRPIDEVFPDD